MSSKKIESSKKTPKTHYSLWTHLAHFKKMYQVCSLWILFFVTVCNEYRADVCHADVTWDESVTWHESCHAQWHHWSHEAYLTEWCHPVTLRDSLICHTSEWGMPHNIWNVTFICMTYETSHVTLRDMTRHNEACRTISETSHSCVWHRILCGMPHCDESCHTEWHHSPHMSYKRMWRFTYCVSHKCMRHATQYIQRHIDLCDIGVTWLASSPQAICSTSHWCV